MNEIRRCFPSLFVCLRCTYRGFISFYSHLIFAVFWLNSFLHFIWMLALSLWRYETTRNSQSMATCGQFVFVLCSNCFSSEMQTNNKSNSHKKVLEGVTTRHKQLNFVMKMPKLANTLEERRNRKKNKKKTNKQKQQT